MDRQTERQTERQTDRQTDRQHELHVYVGLAQARPKYAVCTRGEVIYGIMRTIVMCSS